jgi:branched-chain amino acid transport system permease protein
MLLQLLVSGIANGSIYAIVALGIALIYRSTRLLNFAHGEIFMLGAYLGYTCYRVWKLPYAAAVAATLAAGLLLGLFLERLFRRPVAAGEINSVILATIGLGIVFKGTVRLVWHEEYLTFPPIYGVVPFSVGPVLVSPQDVIIGTMCLVLMAVFFGVFQLTALGKRLRGSVSNRLGALLLGIRVERMFAAAWALSCMLGVMAGLLVAPISLVYPDMGFSVFVKAFAGAVLGGLGSFYGAIVGCLVVGIVENVVGGYVSTQLVGPAPFVIIAGVLLLMPTGLFGRAEGT